MPPCMRADTPTHACQPSPGVSAPRGAAVLSCARAVFQSTPGQGRSPGKCSVLSSWPPFPLHLSMQAPMLGTWCPGITFITDLPNSLSALEETERKVVGRIERSRVSCFCGGIAGSGRLSSSPRVLGQRGAGAWLRPRPSWSRCL